MLQLFKTTRPGNIAIALATLAVGCLISGGDVSARLLAADAFAFALAIAFGNTLNDIFDFRIDSVCHPERPIPSGKVSLFEAGIFCAICPVLAVLTCAALARSPFFALFYGSLFLLLFLYDRYLKRIPLVKNVTVAFLCTTPLVRAAFLPGGNVHPLFAAIGFAFLLTLAREIIKDLEDASGDREGNVVTLSAFLGNGPAKILAMSSLFLATFGIPVPVLLGSLSAVFLALLVPMVPLCVRICRETVRGDFRKAQKWTKAAMPVGLVFLLLASL